ncbi:hypothetical protein F5B21DRAFT_473638 [Xylaria acuta]|nr:hypothetical protein F5B21DRAFT_473638 [Xylaria acuta]
MEYLDIMYGTTKYRFLSKVPVYRQETKGSSTAATDDEDTDETGNFWRMVHLNRTDIVDGARRHPEHGENFRQYGVREGMSEDECSDEAGHPHFIPGVFIAMAQRYRLEEWDGQGGEEKDGQNDKREMANGAPTWQILLTDGPRDRFCAHLYTAQVPGFIVDSFEAPAAPTSTQGNGTTDRENGNRRFKFPIRHNRVPYAPFNTFRERLRYAITVDRDGFGTTGKDA